MRLTEKYNYENYTYCVPIEEHILNISYDNFCYGNVIEKLGQFEDIEEKLGIDLITFLKGIDPDTCFMQITKDKQFYLCGDAYYGNYSKEELLKFIQELLFMYWALTKEKLL